MRTVFALALLALLAACSGGDAPNPAPAVPPLAPTSTPERFTEAAAALGARIAWVQDDGDGLPQAGEGVTLWGPGAAPTWFAGDKPTDALRALWAETSSQQALPADPSEAERRRLVRQELASSRPAVLLTDLRQAAPWERDFVHAMERVAERVERLYALQSGSAELHPADDPESRALFARNQGPWCVQPATESQAACSASLGAPPQLSGAYPAALQADPRFCDAVQAQPGLMDSPFTAVRRDADGALVAVPYTTAWPEAMDELGAALVDAAALLPAEEAALATYLKAAAKAAHDNDWFAADASWAAMNAKNSRYYVRVAPDETYWDPCDRKAGFALVVARIDPEGLVWQSRLDPLRDVFEALVAKHAGPVYQARHVAFAMPEFIQVALNAGDGRSPVGGTIGQSLPNWGPVAAAGGRTVAMTNLGTDPVSLATRREQAASVLCSLDHYSDDPEHLLLSTLLHEAAHNLGPAQSYTINGRTDEQVFGGELASMLEELKAQTAALTLADHVVSERVITEDFGRSTHTADVVWAIGKVAAGVRDSSGSLKPYPALAAIQLGLLEDAGALKWEPQTKAANGKDVGCLAIDFETLSPALSDMATRIIGAKARGDVPEVKALVAEYVDGPRAERFATYAERWARAPDTTYVYGVRYE